MRIVLLVVAMNAFHAHADLYRWVDRESGSVKYSNTPPAWFGDQERERSAPAVEVLRYRGPGVPAKPPAAPETLAAASLVAALETRWAGLVQFFATLPPSTDFSRAGAGIQQQVAAYQALSAELDRLDPAGTPRRRAQEASAFRK